MRARQTRSIRDVLNHEIGKVAKVFRESRIQYASSNPADTHLQVDGFHGKINTQRKSKIS